MSLSTKKLQLTRETVKSLTVRAGLRTGDGASLVAQGSAGGRGPGSGPRGIPGEYGSVGCGVSAVGLAGGGFPVGGVLGNGGH